MIDDVRSVLIALLWMGCGVPDDPFSSEPFAAAPARSAAGALQGRVTDAAGAPVVGAFVTVAPGGFEATTDASGAYLVPRLSPGEVQVVVAAPGFAVATSPEVAVVEDQTTTVDLTLGPGETQDGLLRLHVFGPDGNPWSGAMVSTTAGPSGVTDAAGALTLTALAGLSTDLTIADSRERLWPRTVRGVMVPSLGAVDLSLTLAGRAADGSGYGGSTLCALCHAETASSWATTAHARAQTAVEGAPAEAFATGLEVDLGGPVARLATVDGVPTLTLVAESGVEDAWIVAGFLGGEDRGAVPWAERDGRAWPLPVAWVAPDAERAEWQPGGWVAGDTSAWFTAEGELAYDGSPGVESSAETACFGCHATGYVLETDGAGVSMQAANRTGSRWTEAAVGCESCHGPGLDHTSGPLSEKVLRITNPDDLDARGEVETCGQCHRALAGDGGTPYAWSEVHGLFRPGGELSAHASSAFLGWSDGAAAVPGAQGDELAASGHGAGAWAARCSDCHDPHGSGQTADLRLPSTDNTLCLSCHLSLDFAGSEAEAEAHVAHVNSPGSLTASGRCTGCHMPQTAARMAWDDASAAGDLASHLFVAIPPADTLADFDAAGADLLPPGAFVPNACQECHAWNEHLFRGGFPGPAGDMSARTTHEALDASFEEKYP